MFWAIDKNQVLVAFHLKKHRGIFLESYPQFRVVKREEIQYLPHMHMARKQPYDVITHTRKVLGHVSFENMHKCSLEKVG